MTVDRELAQAVGSLPTVTIQSRFYRFTSRKRLRTVMDGSKGGGRWGPPGAFRVLYLTDDYEGCVIEAYRHSVDPGQDPTPQPVEYRVVTCDVSATNILDLRTAAARIQVGLTPDIIHSEPQAPSGAAYTACGNVASIAHQLNRHGLLIPSATHRGLTLAMFTDRLPESEKPRLIGGVTSWPELPADPRTLRIIYSETDGA